MTSVATTPGSPIPVDNNVISPPAISLPAGTEVVARYSFKGNSPEDLSFVKGDIITVITPTSDPNWYKARHVDGRLGLVPYNYIQKRSEVKLNAMPWFHGKITRDDAETLLRPRDVSHFLFYWFIVALFIVLRVECRLSRRMLDTQQTNHRVRKRIIFI
jgi:hypothetical protein